jgi:hypothetical protein
MRVWRGVDGSGVEGRRLGTADQTPDYLLGRRGVVPVVPPEDHAAEGTG